jgi:hypothetical protein
LTSSRQHHLQYISNKLDLNQETRFTIAGKTFFRPTVLGFYFFPWYGKSQKNMVDFFYPTP